MCVWFNPYNRESREKSHGHVHKLIVWIRIRMQMRIRNPSLKIRIQWILIQIWIRIKIRRIHITAFRMKELFIFFISSFVALVQEAIKINVFKAMKSDHSSLENPPNLLCFI